MAALQFSDDLISKGLFGVFKSTKKPMREG
jgi:hypothetical protein